MCAAYVSTLLPLVQHLVSYLTFRLPQPVLIVQLLNMNNYAISLYPNHSLIRHILIYILLTMQVVSGTIESNFNFFVAFDDFIT
jgi:hypothetical protein